MQIFSKNPNQYTKLQINRVVHRNYYCQQKNLLSPPCIKESWCEKNWLVFRL